MSLNKRDRVRKLRAFCKDTYLGVSIEEADSTFLNRPFLNGLFLNGLFLNGLFLNGLFLNGLFLNGPFINRRSRC
jgi:hypothetical protein